MQKISLGAVKKHNINKCLKYMAIYHPFQNTAVTLLLINARMRQMWKNDLLILSWFHSVVVFMPMELKHLSISVGEVTPQIFSSFLQQYVFA